MKKCTHFHGKFHKNKHEITEENDFVYPWRGEILKWWNPVIGAQVPSSHSGDTRDTPALDRTSGHAEF